MEERVPGGEVRFPFRGDVHLPQHDFVEMLLMHQERHLIDCGGVDALDHRVGLDVAELRHFAAHADGDVFFGAKHKHVGLYAHLLQELH